MSESEQQHEPQRPEAPAPPTPPGPGVPPGPQGGAPARVGWARDPYHPFDPRRKSPFLASFLSVVPGLGQIYVGYYQAGFIHALVFGGIIVMMVNEILEALLPLQGIFLGFFYLYNIVDAGRRAAFFNAALEGGDSVKLPKDYVAPGTGGSMMGGLFLIGIGVALLAHTALDFSLAWVEDWWPLAPVGFWIFLVARAMKERAQAENDRG
jgi:TM2 domain-containing membrane protein YozV